MWISVVCVNKLLLTNHVSGNMKLHRECLAEVLLHLYQEPSTRLSQEADTSDTRQNTSMIVYDDGVNHICHVSVMV